MRYKGLPRHRVWIALVALVLPSGCGGAAGLDSQLDGGPLPQGDANVDGGQGDPYAWWEGERAARQAALDAYLADHEDGVRSLLYAPLGTFGIPLAAINDFSDVMPDIWGPPEEKFAAIGLGPDLYDPSNELPLGIAPFTLAGVDYGMVSCGTCHVGRVQGPDGDDILLIGAPNTRLNAIFSAFERTAADPRWSDLGSGATLAESTMITAMGAALQLRRSVEEHAFNDFTFSLVRHPNAPDAFALDRPGFFDSFSVIFSMQTLQPYLIGPDSEIDAIMPYAPAEADIMSLWRQSERPAAEWDGSLPHPIYRNLAASIGAVVFGAAVNYDPSAAAATLSQDLPPPPYPFPVDGERAGRGEVLFESYCAGCHHSGANTVFRPSVTGTDPNRALAVTEAGRAKLLTALRNACTDAVACDATDEEIVADVSDPSVLGYLALPLDGIWARAPYLHNGSVPTLRHLLVPSSRPTVFYRGAPSYDTDDVGFSWDLEAASEPYTHAFDTRLDGRSNGGHDDPMFLGIDWGANPEELADLLEYLKTL